MWNRTNVRSGSHYHLSISSYPAKMQSGTYPKAPPILSPNYLTGVKKQSPFAHPKQFQFPVVSPFWQVRSTACIKSPRPRTTSKVTKLLVTFAMLLPNAPHSRRAWSNFAASCGRRWKQSRSNKKWSILGWVKQRVG